MKKEKQFYIIKTLGFFAIAVASLIGKSGNNYKIISRILYFTTFVLFGSDTVRILLSIKSNKKI